mmetsp:Transcript_30503/g.73615  ORF Transcript_30503/g.73615 Transcript_30503/m.73615 type:complete len:95 (-) Transcript_30503:720-1004(-)
MGARGSVGTAFAPPSQSVYGKQPMPSGHWSLLPNGQGTAQSALASSKVVPQKNELASSHGVDGKHDCPMGQSLDDPLGQGIVQLVDASVQVTPQ